MKTQKGSLLLELLISLLFFGLIAHIAFQSLLGLERSIEKRRNGRISANQNFQLQRGELLWP